MSLINFFLAHFLKPALVESWKMELFMLLVNVKMDTRGISAKRVAMGIQEWEKRNDMNVLIWEKILRF